MIWLARNYVEEEEFDARARAKAALELELRENQDRGVLPLKSQLSTDAGFSLDFTAGGNMACVEKYENGQHVWVCV